jgi:hypothetical protein
MTVQELVIALDDARDSSQVLVGEHPTNTKSIVDVQIDEDGNFVLIIKEDEITANLTSEDDD